MLSKQQLLKKLGERIRYARMDAGLKSQEALSDKTGLHRNYIGKLERGLSNPPVYTLYRISAALGRKDLLDF